MKNQLSRRKFLRNAGAGSACVFASAHGLTACKSNEGLKVDHSRIGVSEKTSSLLLNDGLCNPAVSIRPYQLMSLVCIKGGAACPFMDNATASGILERMAKDPTLTIQLKTHVDELPRYTKLNEDNFSNPDREDVLNRKRDLEVLRRLGFAPGDTRRARYLYELLFSKITTTRNICTYDTKGWEGCSLSAGGAYEKVREKGWQQMVYQRSKEEMDQFRKVNAEHIEKDGKLYVRPHHLMCFSCWYAGGKGQGLRSNDTLSEIWQRIKRDPDVPVTLVEGTCSACDCCDGFYPDNGRCVHSCGIIRDYLKDLTVFQKMGLMPGATLKGKDAFALLFERVHSTREVCGFGDGIETADEWKICGGPEGNPGYELTRISGVF